MNTKMLRLIINNKNIIATIIIIKHILYKYIYLLNNNLFLYTYINQILKKRDFKYLFYKYYLLSYLRNFIIGLYISSMASSLQRKSI